MKKKILPLITTAAVLSLSLSAVGADKHISVDGADIENSDVIEYEGHVCFPVRAVAESMGLSVEWTGETKTVVITNGGPIYVTFSIGEDAYTFAKTAPMPVGCPPVLVEEKHMRLSKSRPDPRKEPRTNPFPNPDISQAYL